MWFNPIITWLLKSPFHVFVSKNMMLMTYTGRKSGKTYTVPMNYVSIRNGDRKTLYTQSYRERRWWRNLRNGAEVNLHLRGKDCPALADVVEDERQVARELGHYLVENPKLARYYQIELNANGRPSAEDLERQSKEMVMVKTVILPGE